MTRISDIPVLEPVQPVQSELKLSPREIWMNALGMVDNHGSAAREMASCQAAALIDRGDLAGAEIWSRVLRAIDELQRVELRGGESVH
jgi:hypothetical protein